MYSLVNRNASHRAYWSALSMGSCRSVHDTMNRLISMAGLSNATNLVIAHCFDIDFLFLSCYRFLLTILGSMVKFSTDMTMVSSSGSEFSSSALALVELASRASAGRISRSWGTSSTCRLGVGSCFLSRWGQWTLPMISLFLFGLKPNEFPLKLSYLLLKQSTEHLGYLYQNLLNKFP